MSDFLSKIAELLSGDAEPFEMPRQPVPQMRPAQPLSTGRRLGRAIFGEDALGEFEKRQLLDRDRLAAEQEMYDAAPGLNTPIPGGNPEASTPMDAMMGLAMSGGGLPGAVGRTGESAARRPGGRRSPSLRQAELDAYWARERDRIRPKTQEEATRLAEQEAADYYSKRGPLYEKEMASIKSPGGRKPGRLFGF